MKVFYVYKSDKDGKTKRVVGADSEQIPCPRVGDLVLAEGRPRQVSSRRFHTLGPGHSGNWANTLNIVEGDPCVEVYLIG